MNIPADRHNKMGAVVPAGGDFPTSVLKKYSIKQPPTIIMPKLKAASKVRYITTFLVKNTNHKSKLTNRHRKII